MAELIRQVRPAWAQLQQLESPLPPHALRHALLALGVGLLVMAGLAALSTFWAPTRAWWDAAEHGSAMAAGVQASLLAAVATAVGALPVFLVTRVSKLQEAALLSFSAGVMLAAAIFALLLPSLDAGQALLGGRTGAAALSGDPDQFADAVLVEGGERVLGVDALGLVDLDQVGAIVPRQAQGGLGQVVGAEGEELGVPGDGPGGERGPGHLDHRADLGRHRQRSTALVEDGGHLGFDLGDRKSVV